MSEKAPASPENYEERMEASRTNNDSLNRIQANQMNDTFEPESYGYAKITEEDVTHDEAIREDQQRSEA